MERSRREAVAQNRRQLPPFKLSAWRACRTTRVEAGGETLKRVPRGDLRLPPFVHVTADARLLNPPRLRAFGLQMIQTSVIDGLKRQAILKPLDGRSVELAGGLERPFSLELDAVAVEAEGRGIGARNAPLAGQASEPVATGDAHRLRASAFELSTVEGNPFPNNNFLGRNSRPRHVASSSAVHEKECSGRP
jgi:hypothetical protein